MDIAPFNLSRFRRALNWGIPVLMLLAFGLIGWRVYASMGSTGDFTLNDSSGKPRP